MKIWKLTLIFLFLTSNVFANTRDGLVGWWKLDETTGTSSFDSSWNGNTGTWTNTPTSAPNCARNNCLDFSGTAYVSVADSPTIGLTGDMSITAWVKVKDRVAYRGILGKTTINQPNPYDYYLTITSGVAGFLRGNGATNGSFSATSPPAVGVWQFVAVTMAGNAVVHYLNGNTNGSGTITTTITNNALVARIGSRADGATQMLGQIDDVRLYNRALTAQEVLDLYNAGLFIRGTGTKLNYAPNL